MPNSPRIVAIGLLTEHEVRLLGRGFDRAFPIDDDNVFEDLLRAIDQAELQVRAEIRESPKPSH